jgi:hypothetical protein
MRTELVSREDFLFVKGIDQAFNSRRSTRMELGRQGRDNVKNGYNIGAR